jgi:hypothetical protein
LGAPVKAGSTCGWLVRRTPVGGWCARQSAANRSLTLLFPDYCWKQGSQPFLGGFLVTKRRKNGLLDQVSGPTIGSKTGNGGIGSFYRSKHELIFVFKVGSREHVNSFGLGDTGRYRTNVWDYPGLSSRGANHDAELATALHRQIQSRIPMISSSTLRRRPQPSMAL